MAVALDVGTFFLVKSRLDEIGNDTEFTVQRNCFLQTVTSDDTEEILKENKWAYVKHGDDYYIIGEHAIQLKNLLTLNSKDKEILVTKVGDLRRPMKSGVLNTGEEKLSVAIIQKLIGNLLGPPQGKNECLCFCAPGDAVDQNITTVFHKTMLTSFMKSLGYDVECINEAMAVIYSERPVADDPNEEGGIAPFSGLAFSFGSGMSNCCFAYKKLPLISFSVAKGGDYIDQEASKVAGLDVSAMTRFKETKLNLNNIDYSDMRQAALDIFYQNLIEHALTNTINKFNQLTTKIESSIEIIIAGGTSMVPGFLDKFKQILGTLEVPFTIKNVRMAKNPFYAVSNGCLIKALSTEKKKTQEKSKK